MTAEQYQTVLTIAAFSFVLQMIVSVWVVVTINRLLRTQTLALGLMQALAARSGFRESVEKIQAKMPTTKIRKEDQP